MTAGQVPDTSMTGDTAKISHIAEFSSFDWIMLWDNVPGYPDSKETLNRYLELAIDTGFALMAKILKPNGQFVCGTMLLWESLPEHQRRTLSMVGNQILDA